MRGKKKKPVYLPLSQALSWIVASTLLFSGTSHALIKQYFKKRSQKINDPHLALRSIIQTGPQKEALKTRYLAELLGISSDRPCYAKHFDLQSAKQRLLRSPLISCAEVKLSGSDTLYIDYTIRQPLAWLEDYENITVDKEGYPFPFSPFFTPKNLPAIYLGLSPFGTPSPDPDRPTARFGTPLEGKYFSLALDLLSIVTDPKVADLFSVKRIDVSNAFAESYGTREIVVMTEDTLIQQAQGREVQFTLPRILRLSTKHYAQELGNYLKLREQLLEEERQSASASEHLGSTVRLKEKIIDFRIQKLAFIEDYKKHL
jgi:hypothetical protein